MANAPLQTLDQPSAFKRPEKPSSGRWILNSRLDLVLFVMTPLLIVPSVMLLRSPWIGVKVETIGLVVVAFGALGHHFPGLIRAYGDRDLFQRFVLAPLLIFVIYFPLSQYHRTYMTMMITAWGCWHGLMQVYGFVRIYDVKVGSVSRVTANWDWLMCLCWFLSAEFFTNNKPNGSELLELWYHMHGVTPPLHVQMFRWILLAVSIAVLFGFLVNHVVQTSRGQKPNSAKLLMLASGIGFWWFAMVFIENPILGVALFEVFHDVQYLAIVWLYNCRRVNANSEIGSLMKFLFRRGMLLLYVSLVFAYGLMGLVPHFSHSETLKSIFTGLITTSTILHFYSDGFIWKVREQSTQASLGLGVAEAPSRMTNFTSRELPHIVKWSPLIAFIGWLFVADLTESNEQIGRKDRENESIEFFETLVKQSPSNASGHQRLGEIHQTRGELDKAVDCFSAALANAKTKEDRTLANHRLGELFLEQKQYDLAKTKFRDALQEDPEFKASIKVLQTITDTNKASP